MRPKTQSNKTLILIELSNLFEQRQKKIKLNKSLYKTLLETLMRINQEFDNAEASIKLIEFGFLISDQDKKNNSLTVDQDYAPSEYNLDNAERDIEKSTLYKSYMNQKINLIPFSKVNPVVNKELIKEHTGQSFENIIIMGSNDQLRSSIKNSFDNDVLDIKIHRPTEFDYDDYQELKNKLKTLKSHDQLQKFEGITVYLDIDNTVLPWDLSKRKNETLINPQILELKSLLERYFDKSKITYKVLTARKPPHKPNIDTLVNIRNRSATFRKTVHNLTEKAKIELTSLHKSTIISEEKYNEGIKSLNDLLKNPTNTWRVILALEHILETKIDIRDIYFTANQQMKHEIIDKECQYGALNRLIIFTDDTYDEFIPAQDLAKKFEENHCNTHLHVIRAQGGGDLRSDDYDNLFDSIVDYTDQQQKARTIEDTQDISTYTKLPKNFSGFFKLSQELPIRDINNCNPMDDPKDEILSINQFN